MRCFLTTFSPYCSADPPVLHSFPTRRSSDLNADDWGRSGAETDAALRCYKGGRITSVSAMVFMQDSERADRRDPPDRKSTRLNSSHVSISYAVFCLKKKTCR